jgi:hypothetical protein
MELLFLKNHFFNQTPFLFNNQFQKHIAAKARIVQSKEINLSLSLNSFISILTKKHLSLYDKKK